MRRLGNIAILLLTSVLISTFSVSNADAEMAQLQCRSNGTLSSSRGRKVLADTQENYRKIESLHAHFLQHSYLSSLEISEQSAGLMWFTKPGLMKWHYSEPQEQDFVIKDNTYWLYQVQDKQVVIDEFSQILISDLPIAFIMGLGDLVKDFSLVSACEAQDGSSYVLELAPKQEQGGKNELKKFLLSVDKRSLIPIGSQVTDMAGNVTRMVFSSIETDKVISPEVYSTKFPEGIDINDRRTGRG
ncbi:MAG: outer membrane lipoprotein carrier protein LolA [Deltaproteobacteria bacterium]|nr:outer membrane lipoprotein carrier protein LolA [Deltaproteobacteria bacterium]